MAVRLKDIARDLGISPMAVSKALRGHTDIGAETRKRVLKHAANLNYRSDWAARTLKGGETFLVSFVLVEPLRRHRGFRPVP